MPDAKVLPDWIARRGETPRPVFACSCTNAGLDAASALVGCELDLAKPGQLDRPGRGASTASACIVTTDSASLEAPQTVLATCSSPRAARQPIAETGMTSPCRSTRRRHR